MRVVLTNTLVFLTGIWIGSQGISEALLSDPEIQVGSGVQESDIAPGPWCLGEYGENPEGGGSNTRAVDLGQKTLWQPVWSEGHHGVFYPLSGYLVPSIVRTEQNKPASEAREAGDGRRVLQGDEVAAPEILQDPVGSPEREPVTWPTTANIELVEQIHAIATDLGIEPELAISMAKVESNFDHRAVSPKGAIGVLQVMPQFACKDFEITPEMLFEPEVNIRVGLSYMKIYMERFDSDLDLSLAAYNAGASRVVRAGYSVPAIRETQQYVRKVKQTLEHLRGVRKRS